MSIEKYTYLCDIKTQQVIQDCQLKPSEITQTETYWLYAKNNKYDPDMNLSKVGKWMIFPSKFKVDELWERVKEGVRMGDLWDAKVATTKPSGSQSYVIIIYTKDYEDVVDVVKVLEYLERTGIKATDKVIYYKTDEQTYAGVYAGHKQKASIYASSTVRKLLNK